MQLIPVSEDHRAAGILYMLLKERPESSWISHSKLPTWEEHCQFVAVNPYRYWYLIVDDEPVGALEVLPTNELGVSILGQCRRQGYASRAIKQFMATHEPLPAIPAIRNGHWLANIAVGNEQSKAFFRKIGFKSIQETYIYAPE